MPTRNIKIAKGEIYHLCNRTNNKQTLFKDNRDWIRFLILVLYFQSPLTIYNISRIVNIFDVRRPASNKLVGTLKSEIVARRYVEVLCFSLMPNHFHILLKENEEGGIVKYVHKIQTAYAKYFNTKYKKSGHLFQGPFRAVHIENNEQLLHTSAYIHRNPRELRKWSGKKHLYPWSSYQDYTEENRWGDLLCRSIILDQFDEKNSYEDFLKTSPAKLTE